MAQADNTLTADDAARAGPGLELLHRRRERRESGRRESGQISRSR